MNELIFLGAGKLTRCALDLMLNESDQYKKFKIFDDKKTEMLIAGKHFEILGTIDKGIEFIIANKMKCFVSLGINGRKRSLEILKHLDLRGIAPVSIISKNAFISNSSQVGTNCLVFPGTFIGSNNKIGNLFTAYSNVSIEHDIQIGDGSVVCPQVAIAGNVKIGNLVFLGIHSTVSNNIVIGDRSVLGAGSVVVNNIAENQLAYGNPAKSIRKIDNNFQL